MATDGPPIPEIARILHAVEDADGPASSAARLIGGISDPPSYVVKLVLVLGCGFKFYRQWEKSAWQVYVRYKGFTFALTDWKRGSWSISSDTDNDDARAAAEELRKKVSGAAKLLDQLIAAYGRERIAKGEFYVHSNYWKIRGAYEHFRDLVQEAVEKSGAPVDGEGKPAPLDQIVEQLNELIRADTALAYNGYAMVGFYFSSLEVLFDVMFALSGGTGEDYLTFRQGTWAERFKTVLPPSSSSELNSLYGRLLAIKRDFRDNIFHGLGGDESLLVLLGREGLVPVSYESLTRALHYRPTTMDTELVRDALSLFNEFDNWLESNEPYSLCLEFASSGFDIPLHRERREEIQAAMTSPDNFRAWLEEQSRIVDYLSEQY